ncbi:M48 family metallopeptidase [Desulfonatronum sp. SC1]|uniref:M48 family metallopeptidase n=1 Tax=Desulfonatronum sp. SC1 TaxID=2109626 RepID=UPI001304B6C6|nr:SprT family zinc-dependent metalloprotease [Desulfonatronum sp. SC1]
MQRVELADGRSCPYRIQESDRARRIRLKLSATEGMVVIVPAGTVPHRDDLERLIRTKSRWITRHLHRFAQQERVAQTWDLALPGHIHLSAINERWEVRYADPDANQAPMSTRVRVMTQGVLRVCGPESGRAEDCAHALRAWARAKAGAVLPAWLDELAQDLRMSFSRVSIRDQRTRWGSCSRHGRINLNCKLLFLPRPWTRYVLIHELCHTKIMNHGPDFWALVAMHEPQARRIRTEMRSAWMKIPAWMTTA